MTEDEKLAAAKEQAKAKAGEKVTKTRDSITFKKGSDSGVVFSVLEKAKKPLSLKEVTERCVKAGIKNPNRVKTVANWFATNGIAKKDEKKCYELLPSSAVEVVQN